MVAVVLSAVRMYNLPADALICVRLFVAAETNVPTVEPFDVALVLIAVTAATVVTVLTVVTAVTVETVVTPVTAVTVPIFHVPTWLASVKKLAGGLTDN